MLKASVSIDDTIDFLNGLLDVDRVAVGALITTRVPCNDLLLDHPTVQAGPVVFGGPGVVGILGLLNGLFGTISEGKFTGWGALAAVLEPDGSVARFQRTDRPEEAICEKK